MKLLLLFLMFAGQPGLPSPGRVSCWFDKESNSAKCIDSVGREILASPGLDVFFAPEPKQRAADSRIYHPVAIARMAENRHTHIQVVGWVTMVKHEEDGDTHIRICAAAKIKGMDRGRCIVGEVIPCYTTQELGCVNTVTPPGPLRGKRVRAKGISRFDKENGHSWWEIHPLESLEILP